MWNVNTQYTQGSGGNNMAGFVDLDPDIFPLQDISSVVSVFRHQLTQVKQPNLALLSIIVGAVENSLTCNRNFTVEKDTEYNEGKLPAVEYRIVNALYMKFHAVVKGAVDVTLYGDSKYANRDLIKRVSDVVWNSLTRSYYKDRAHLQSLFSYLTGNKLDCFGVAFAVVAGCQVLGYNDVHLALSEDHAWVVFGEHGEETAEVTWHGKGNEDKRGQPVAGGAGSRSWLYVNGYPVVCTRQMEVAALVSAINPSLSATSDAIEVALLQQELLWLLYDLNHISKYPMALDKNDPSRFLGDGMTFKAKLIGILEVNEARGDKMCQDALNDLKTAVRAAGEHKQRITISIAIDGLRLRDEKTGDSMYHHPVHKISFIAQDMSDSRAFGYIFGSPDTGHRFFGIKTDKTASQVVIAMRDLFQVVFELKKKEIEMAKHHIEQHQMKFTGSNSYNDHSSKEADTEKSKSKTSEHSRSLSASQVTNDHTTSPTTVEGAGAQRNSEAIADLLDLEDELNNIQQGISQMDKITPSDPFGPINGKGESFLESFKDKTPEPPALPKLATINRRTVSQGSNDGEKSASLFSSAASTSSRAHFFPQFSPNVRKSKDDSHWFDQETDSLFSDAVANQPDPATSPVTFHTPTGEEPVLDDKRSPKKIDLFTDLDPLGTGKVKPYLDKKDFFQELKNPPKKVLKELLSEPTKVDTTHYFPVDFDSQKLSQNTSSKVESSVIQNTLSNTSSTNLNSFSPKENKPQKADPFEDTDPFEKTDPFLEESFPKSIGFPPLLNTKISLDYKYDKVPRKSEEYCPTSPSKSRFFSTSIHGPLRVSLPPEKPDTNTTISLSSLASRFRSSPSPTEEPKSHRRKHYQTLKQSLDDRSDDQSQSPILEEVYMRGSPKSFASSATDRKYFIGSPPTSRSDKMKSKISSSLELLDSTPDPPLRPKTALYAIKPPPLPPKKQNQPNFRPPARPPSLEESSSQYDYLRHKTETKPTSPRKESENSPKKKLLTSISLTRKESTSNLAFPLLPPPPQRKTPTESGSKSNITTPTSAKAPSPENKSVLNITLNQLDQSGFETLASTLGIPTENVCNMTLQQLTKMLAQKYLGPIDDARDSNIPRSIDITNPSFTADFESNFGNLRNEKAVSPTFDRYAVFKELQEEEERAVTEVNTNDDVVEDIIEEKMPELPINDEIKNPEEEEDKYAALRQLSLCAQKSENLSEELDISNEEDSSARADNISDCMRHHTDDSFTPLNVLDIPNESPVAKSLVVDEQEETNIENEKDSLPHIEEVKEEKEWTPLEENREISVFEEKESYFGVKQEDDLFDMGDKDNWATFEKEPAAVEVKKTDITETPLDNENSPISSDGKDEPKKKTSWSKKTLDDGIRCAPWNDEDESWDDYSAKESYWSDESSHDGHSPLKETPPSYMRRPLNKHSRSMKAPPMWNENIPHWHRRWEDDTEDEYDDLWRKRRMRPTSFDRERKREKGYDGYEKSFNWSREFWESDRIPRAYEERRKGGSSAGEFRRRCDSDASDKEYTKYESCYSDPRGDKPKQYYMHQPKTMDRHWPDQRESRCKFKKPTGHKRPSSASEAKRYEKIYSPVDHSPRSLEKPEIRESEDEEFPSRFHSARKDPRYTSMEYYGSYDRRAHTMYHRRAHRGKRGVHPGTKDLEVEEVSSMGRPNNYDKINYFPPETPNSAQSFQSEDTPEPAKELHFKFEDDFIPTTTGRTSPRKLPNDSQKENRLPEDEWNAKVTSEDNFRLQDNNNSQRFTSSEGKCLTERGKMDISGVKKKPSLKGKNHFAKLGRQDSSTSLRKSESINIFSRDSDPFEDDDFFSGSSSNNAKLNKFAEKSKSNSNVSDPFAWKEMFSDIKLDD